MADLEAAIACNRQSLNLRPSGRPDRSRPLNNLANTVYTRFEQLGNLEDLEEAIEHHCQALNLHASDHPAHASSLNGRRFLHPI
jgi:tetratricopeptide (TPR) repeat protein